MYKRILVPIDIQEGERTRKMSLERAVELCRFYDAKMFALTVVPDMGMPIVADYFPSDAGDKIVADAENLLHELVDAHIPDDIDVQHLVAQGSISWLSLISKHILRSPPPQSPPGRSRPIRDIPSPGRAPDCRNRPPCYQQPGAKPRPLASLPLRSEHATNSFPESLGSPRILAVPTEWAQTVRL
jgi:hypothetical protein